MTVTVSASARKSKGEFKPLFQYSNGQTHVVEQSPERCEKYTKREGWIPGKRYARGTTYSTREEAVAAAQAVMDASREEAESRLAKFIADGRPQDSIDRVKKEVEFWAGR